MKSNAYTVGGCICLLIGIATMGVYFGLNTLRAFGWTELQWPAGTGDLLIIVAGPFLIVGASAWWMGNKETRESIAPVDIDIRPNQVTVSGGTAVPVLFSSSSCLFRDAEGLRALAQAIYQQSAHFENSRITQGRSATVRVWPEALDWNIEHIHQLDSMLEGAFSAPVYEVNGKPLAIAEPGLSQVLA